MPSLLVLHRERDLHHDRVGVGIGHVVGDEPVLPARGCARDPAGHAASIERPGRRGHVSRLEVREGRSVGDDVLQRLDVRVVDRGVVDVAEDAVCDREPHLRRRVASGAQAVLAREAEVGECARAVRGDLDRGAPGGRGESEDDEHDGGESESGRPPPWRRAAHILGPDAIPAEASSPTATASTVRCCSRRALLRVPAVEPPRGRRRGAWRGCSRRSCGPSSG